MKTASPTDPIPFVKFADVALPCRADSDDSTPVAYRWYHDGDRVDYDDTTYFDEADWSLHIKTGGDEDGGASRLGRYRCVTDNGYSEAEIAYEWRDTTDRGRCRSLK